VITGVILFGTPGSIETTDANTIAHFILLILLLWLVLLRDRAIDIVVGIVCLSAFIIDGISPFLFWHYPVGHISILFYFALLLDRFYARYQPRHPDGRILPPSVKSFSLIGITVLVFVTVAGVIMKRCFILDVF